MIDILQENWNKEKKPGQRFLDWIFTKKTEDITIKEAIEPKDKGGESNFVYQEYLKQKEPPKIKRLDLDSVSVQAKLLSELTEAEREVVRNLLRMTFKRD